MAAHFGSVAMVKQLLESEGNVVDGQNELGYTPLHQAAQQGHSQIVNLLLETGKASPNTVSNVSYWCLTIKIQQDSLYIKQNRNYLLTPRPRAAHEPKKYSAIGNSAIGNYVVL